MNRVFTFICLCSVFFAVVTSQCCQKLDQEFNLCLQCPPNTHKYRQNCILDIPNCVEHENGFDCKKCDQDYKLVNVTRGKFTTQRCEAKIKEIQIDIENPLQMGAIGQAFMISSDYALTVHLSELQGAQVISAIQKIYQNEEQQIVIEYEKTQNGNSKRYYRVVVSIDINTFLMQQKQFRPIPESQLRRNLIKIVTPKQQFLSNYEDLEYEERNINLFDINQQRLLEKADNIVKSLGHKYQGIISSKLRTYSDGTQIIYLTYVKEDGAYEEVSVHMRSRIVLTVGGKKIGGTPNKTNQVNQQANQPQNNQTSEKTEQIQQTVVNKTEQTNNQTNTQSVVQQQKIEPVQDTQNKNMTTTNNSTQQSQVSTTPTENQKNQQEPKNNNQSNSTSPNKQQTTTESNQQTKTQNNQQITQNKQTQAQQETVQNNQTTQNKTQSAQNQTSVSETSNNDTSSASQTQNIQQKQMTNQQSVKQIEQASATDGYTKIQNGDLLKDLYFIVTKDTINKKYDGYNDILPYQAYQKSQNGFKYFILLFNKPDGAHEQITANINLLSYKVQIQTLKQLQKNQSQQSQQPQIVFEQIPSNKLFQNFFFLVGVDKLQKQTAGKYANANFQYVGQNQEEAGFMIFKIIFEENGNENQVIMKLNKKTYVIEILSQINIKNADNTPSDHSTISTQQTQNQVIPQINNETAQQINNKTISQTNNKTTSQANNETVQQINNKTISQTNNETAQEINNQTTSQTNNETAQQINNQTTSQTNNETKSQTNTNNQTSEIEQNNQQGKEQTTAGQQKKANKTQEVQQTQTTANNNQTTSQDKQKQAILQQQNTQKEPIIVQPIQNNTNQKTNNQKSNIQQITQKQQQTQQKQQPTITTTQKQQLQQQTPKQQSTQQVQQKPLNPLIISQVTGFDRLSPQQLANDQTYNKVNNHIKLVNPQIQSYNVIAAFVKSIGFSQSFKIYYEKDNSPTYEAYVTFDVFRNRIFIINFGTIGFSLN